MSNKIITWIAIILSVVALGLAGYFLYGSQIATTATPPCTVGQDPNCQPKQQQFIEAPVYCGYTDGRPEDVLSTARQCESDPAWSYHEFYPNRNGREDNPDAQGGGSEEIDPNEIGACFIAYEKPPETGTEEILYDHYVDTFNNCLGDEDSYAFCVDENATVPDNCEYISSIPGGDTEPL